MKDMRRINKVYPIRLDGHGYYNIFCEIGSEKNSYEMILAAADNEPEIVRKYNTIVQILQSYKTPIAYIVMPEINTALRKVNEEFHPRKLD